MTPDAKGSTQPHAGWSLEGVETDTVLGLARAPLHVSPRVVRAAEQRFLSAFRERAQGGRAPARSSRRKVRYVLALAAALAVALAIFRAGTLFQEEALSYRFKPGARTPARMIEAIAEPVELDFSDGTVVTVERNSRARVGETTHRGARFLLESGRMAFNVVPRADRGDWSVEAGPFQVRVTGTVFTVEWIAAEGALSVEVERGRVIVEGAGQRRELGPGDSFHHREEVAVTEVPTQAQPAAAKAEADVSRPVVAAQPMPEQKSPSWLALVAAGSYAAVLEAAHNGGLRACCEGCSQADLRALADAARLSGNASLADRVLLAQRARFAGTDDAAVAAFLLGRSAEERGDPRAVSWYDTYLAEAYHGRFAGDAMGRKMLLAAKSDRSSGAQVAGQYLVRFRAGAYSRHAQSVIEAAGRAH